MDFEKLRKELILDEDKRLFPYSDTKGKLTIGIGHNLTDKGLSEEIVDLIFIKDVQECIEGLDGNLPWWRNLSEVRQRVLLNMCFNLGITKLLKFKNTLKAMQEGKIESAVSGMRNSKWYRIDVPNRARKLVKMYLRDSEV